MKNRRILEQLGDFVLGKGFYIVLFLCVAAIGISGYYLIRSVSIPMMEPAGASTPVTIPDPPRTEPLPRKTEPVQPPVPSVSEAAAEEPAPAPAEGATAAERESVVTAPAEVPSVPPVYTWPVKGSILREFSVDTLAPDPTLGDWRTHSGLDISAALGTKVLAMSAGTVAEVRQDGLMGTVLVIDHGDGLRSVYCGLAAEPAVAEGDKVSTGTVIGAVGDTAIAEAGQPDHLHLEVTLEGSPTDPREYLPRLG